MNTTKHTVPSAPAAESGNPNSPSDSQWPSRYSTSHDGVLIAHAHFHGMYGGSPAAKGRDEGNPNDDVVAYFVACDKQNPIWPWNPKSRELMTAKQPAIVGVTHAALMEDFDEGYSVIMDAQAAQAVKDRHASDPAYDQYEVLIEPTGIEEAVQVRFEYKDVLEDERLKAASTPGNDAMIVGYDYHFGEEEEYHLPNNHCEWGWLRSIRPTVMEITYGRIISHLLKGYMVALDEVSLSRFRKAFDADERYKNFTLEQDPEGCATSVVFRKRVSNAQDT